METRYAVFSLRSFILIALCGMVFIGHARSVPAEATAYIKDIMEITLRVAPGTGSKVLRMIRSGEMVTVLQKGEGWSRVKVEDGTEGWVVSRYLIQQEPVSIQARALMEENTRLKQGMSNLAGKNAELAKANEELKTALNQFKTDSEALKKELEQLKQGSTEYLTLKKENENLKARQQRMEFSSNKSGKESEDSTDPHVWMVYGVAILVFGMLLGSFFRRGSSGRGKSRLR
jgi:SH3 domain protein